MGNDEVQSAFRKVFKDSRPYGNQTFIIGKDPINRTIKSNIIRHYLEYEGEVPLLAFAYVDEMNSGFVITNQRIVWRYSNGSDCGDVDLEDIQRVEAGRSVLARVMNIVDVTGKKYPNIYLTGMDEVDNFVIQLNEFIAVLNGVDEEDDSDWPTYDDEPEPQTVTKSKPKATAASQNADRDSYLNFLSDFLEKTFARPEFIFDRYIYHIGRDEKSNEKIRKALDAYANLKNDEVPLVCCDVTAFGGAEDGLLLTNKGIYVHNPFKKVRYFPYESIVSINLQGMFAKEIYINDFEIYSPAGFDNADKRNFINLMLYFKNNL